MAMTTNGHQCDHCGIEKPGVVLPDDWEETYVPAEGGWDGTSATFCDRCSTARTLLQGAQEMGDYDTDDMTAEDLQMWDRALDDGEIAALHYYQTVDRIE